MKGYIVTMHNGVRRYHLITPYGGTISESLEETKLRASFGMEFLKGISYPDYATREKLVAWYESTNRGRIVGEFTVEVEGEETIS